MGNRYPAGVLGRPRHTYRDAWLLDICYPAFTFVLYITSGISFGAISPCTAKKEGRKHLIPRM